MSTEEDTMSATGWKHLKMDNDEIVYIVQVDRIVGKRKENKLLKEMSDWNLCGDGFNPKTRETTYIFKKAFQSEPEFRNMMIVIQKALKTSSLLTNRDWSRAISPTATSSAISRQRPRISPSSSGAE